MKTEQAREERSARESLPDPHRPPRRWRTMGRLVALVAILWFFGGPVGAAVGVAIGLYLLVIAPEPGKLPSRLLMLASAVMLLGVVGVILFRGLPDPSGVSPLFVRGNMAANYLAFAALAILVVGILRDRTVDAVLDPPAMGAKLRERPQAEEPQAKRRVPTFVLALFVLAAASFSLRLAMGRSASPDPVADRISEQMMAGTGYALVGLSGQASPTGLRMPAVPVLLWMAKTTQNSATTARALWALLGAATVIFTGLAASRYLGRGAGILAALLVALLPSFWLQDVRLHSSTVTALGVAILVFIISRPLDRGVALGRGAAAGAAAGLIGLTRPEGVLLGLLLLIAWLSSQDPAASLHRSRRAAVATVTLAALAFVYAPWVVRSHSQFGAWWPTTEIGRVAVGANGPSTYSGALVGSYDPGAVRKTSDRTVQSEANEASRDRLLRGQGWRYAQDHFGPLVAVVRVLRAFELWSPTNERAAHTARGLNVDDWLVAWGSFLALLAAAGSGYWLLRRRRAGFLAPVFVAPVAVAVTALVSFGDPLARSSIDPVLAIAAAAGIWGLGRKVRIHRRRSLDAGIPVPHV